jgi:hypothetical protein
VTRAVSIARPSLRSVVDASSSGRAVVVGATVVSGTVLDDVVLVER